MKIKFTDWKVSISFPDIVCMGFLCLIGTSKGGKKLDITIVSSGYISEEELTNNYDLTKLKNSKKDCIKLSVMDFVEQMMAGRTGVKGYKGYFKLQKLEEKQEDL